MNLYFKRFWDETTGDEQTNDWGTSTFYLEADEDLYAIRQVQVFENGQVLKYDEEFLEDEFGGLADQQLEKDEFQEFAIAEEEFNDAWLKFDRKVNYTS